MSILTNPPAEFVVVRGVPYTIYTDFRNWIKIGSLFSDPGKKTAQKLLEALPLCYLPDSLPPTLEEAAYAMADFYAGGGSQGKAQGELSGPAKPVYDFEYDAEYIFSAFWGQYGIDLSEAHVHWHKFKALFMGLHEEHKICKIMGYRSADISKIKNKEEKAFYRKMKRLYRLPDKRSEQEKEQDMIAVLSEAF